MKYAENVPAMIEFTPAATHDHILLKKLDLPEGSFLVFDMGYVDYNAYQQFTENLITYVTKQKSNASYESVGEFEIEDCADNGILKDETIIVRYGLGKKSQHRARRIAFWNQERNKTEVFMSNNFELTAEQIIDIYRKRWAIETLFKQLKQNFPLKYFLGDNRNAIEIQIWMTLIANLLFSVLKKTSKTKLSFSNLVVLVRIVLMDYISIYEYLKDPEKEWRLIIENREKIEEKNLFSL